MKDGTNRSGAEARISLPLRVLVLDDERTTVAVLTAVLCRQGWEVFSAHNLLEAASILAGTVPDVAVVDVYLGEDDGLSYVKELRSRMPDLGIVVISSDDSATLARKAIDSGADDFLPKPFTPEELTLRTRNLGELRQQRRRVIDLESQLDRSVRDNLFPEIVTHSDSMRAVLRLVEKVGPRDLSVLVCGESGTGKELVARAIHQTSRRRSGNFVELNCAALPANLVESELFGHERGAFTGAVASRAGKIEQAAGGTLFLDEIGELPIETQPKLLRALQEKRVTRIGGKESIECDFRLVSATNRDLMEEVREGRFREDLFYRIAVFPVKLPTLRERPEDLDLLLMHFFAQEGMKQAKISPEARELLAAYRWPGNVRELRNFAQAIVLLAGEGEIDAAAVRSYFGSRLGSLGLRSSNRSDNPDAQDRPIRPLAELEREEILYALRRCRGDVSEAARELGMGRATLYKYLKRGGIEPRNYAQA